MRNPTFAVLVTAAITVSAPAWAQRPTIRRAVVTNVRPGHADEFESAVKQYNEVYAKVAGVRSRGMSQSLSGPRQYILLRDYDKWPDLDPGPVSKALAASAELSKINQGIMSRSLCL